MTKTHETVLQINQTNPILVRKGAKEIMAIWTQTRDAIAGLKVTFEGSGKYLQWQSDELEEVSKAAGPADVWNFFKRKVRALLNMLKSEAKEGAASFIFAAALLFVLVGVLFHYVIYLTN